MAFDAGSIIGHLRLEAEHFSHGIHHAAEEAAEGATELAGIFGSLAVRMSGELGEAAAEAGDAIKGMVSGNPIEMVESMVEATTALAMVTYEVGERFDQMDLAVKRTGMSVEWMSKMKGVAAEAHIGIDQLTMGISVLEQRAALAEQGNKGAAHGFERLGISAAEAGQLMDEPEKLFLRVQESISHMGTAAERAAAAKGVLGRAGIALVPVLSKSAEEIDKVGERMNAMGASISETDTHSGEDFARLSEVIHEAMEGIENVTARPILAYLSAHMDELVPKIVSATKSIEEVVMRLPAAWEAASGAWNSFTDGLRARLPFLSSVYDALKELEGQRWEQAQLDAAGVTQGTGANGGVTYNLTMNHDASQSGAQVGEQINAMARSEATRQQQQFKGAMQQAAVEQTMAGGTGADF